jgi:hypothetical protein
MGFIRREIERDIKERKRMRIIFNKVKIKGFISDFY